MPIGNSCSQSQARLPNFLNHAALVLGCVQTPTEKQECPQHSHAQLLTRCILEGLFLSCGTGTFPGVFPDSKTPSSSHFLAVATEPPCCCSSRMCGTAPWEGKTSWEGSLYEMSESVSLGGATYIHHSVPFTTAVIEPIHSPIPQTVGNSQT